MIAVTRLDGTPLVVNADLIETIEQTPDTVLSLANGRKLIVRNAPDDLVQRVIDYKRAIFTASGRHHDDRTPANQNGPSAWRR